VRVYAGDHSRDDLDDHMDHKVEKIHVHPKWSTGSHLANYDYAILELRKPIPLSGESNARAACLPDKSDGSILAEGTKFVASGWGRTSGRGPTPDKLRKVTLPWLPQSDCSRHLYSGLTSAMICAGERGSSVCMGDSGGPLTFVDAKTKKTKIIGVSSFVVGRPTCAHLSVFADVTKVLKWIHIVSGNCNGNGDGTDNATPTPTESPQTTDPTILTTPQHLERFCSEVESTICEPGFCDEHPEYEFCSDDFCRFTGFPSSFLQWRICSA